MVAMTDRNGRYRLEKAPVGRWMIQAMKEGYQLYCQTIDLPAGPGGYDIVLKPLKPQTGADGNVSTSPTDSEKGGTP
jgi:hypothetical protein